MKSLYYKYKVLVLRKVAGSIPDEVIGFFNLPNNSSRNTAMVLTQPLTEIRARDFPEGGWRVRLKTSLPCVSMSSSAYFSALKMDVVNSSET
jgi:hypothetical protein